LKTTRWPAEFLQKKELSKGRDLGDYSINEDGCTTGQPGQEGTTHRLPVLAASIAPTYDGGMGTTSAR